jgi:ribosomal-protein-serine acetyltransferase
VIEIDWDLGEGVRIRTLVPGDADALFALVDANRERLRPWMHWEPTSKSPADLLAFIERSRASSSDAEANGIWVRGALAGTMGLAIDTLANAAEIGYWIAGEHEGKGLITRGCRRFFDEGFRELGLHRIELKAAEGNVRSQAVAERLGMTREGVLREAVRVQAGYLDLIVFGMLEHEWAAIT